MNQGNCFFPVNKEEEEKQEEEEKEEKVEEDGNKQQEEDVIRTTMQCSAAMEQSCTNGPRQLFLSSE